MIYAELGVLCDFTHSSSYGLLGALLLIYSWSGLNVQDLQLYQICSPLQYFMSKEMCILESIKLSSIENRKWLCPHKKEVNNVYFMKHFAKKS